MKRSLLLLRHPATILIGACLVLTILWLPGLQYPIVSDTTNYALLGESVWRTGAYALFGEPYAVHLPLHPILSYPLVVFFGYGWGMKISSLLGGFGVILASFFLLRKAVSLPVAVAVALALPLHHGFVLMTMLGSADLLFTTLFLLSLLAYVCAEDNERFYILVGVLTGLACLTRYNGAPLFPLFFVYTIWKRPRHLRSKWFWWGGSIGVAIFSLWFIRNALVFGDPFYTKYAGELQRNSLGPLAQFFSNFLYYGNPLQNILPLLFLAALYGLWKKGRTYPFLFLAMLTAWVLTSIWWVQAMRFAFPGYPILLGFAFIGIVELIRRHPRHRSAIVMLCVTGVLLSHALAMCLYTYGACNALFDRTIGGISRNLGLTSEGFYTWGLARDYIDAHAEAGSQVFGDQTWSENVFRSDIVVSGTPQACPVYWITQEPREGEEVVFVTADYPVTYVVKELCK